MASSQNQQAGRSGCRFAVIGVDDDANFRLAEILRRINGKENVSRFLEPEHAESFVARHAEEPLVICFDVLNYDPVKATDFIGHIRDRYPRAVFSLYLHKQEFQDRKHELPGQWPSRLSHYYRLHKEADAESVLEPSVRASLRHALWEAEHNTTNEPIRLTPTFDKGLVQSEDTKNAGSAAGINFISYARSDWQGFVSDLTSSLSEGGHKVWLDQNFIVGGDDWMDAIGQALDACDVLLLVMSPQSLASKYVKMEYRYFFQQEKPIVPLMFEKVQSIPFELSALNFVDFTHGDHARAYKDLAKALSQKREK